MNVHGLVEQIDKNRYRVTISQPVNLSAEGESREEAIEHLRQLADQRMTAGQIVEIDLPSVPWTNPWVDSAGIWRDHPDLDDYLANIARYRHQVDEAEAKS